MHGNHWSLILFTLLGQTAAGLAISGIVFRLLTLKKSDFSSIQQAYRLILVLASGTMMAAAIISFFHLGTPLHAIHVLNNLASSWLSREILCVIVFTGSLGLLTIAHILGFSKIKIFPFLEGASLISGIILVFAMARVYMLPTVPVWNHIFTPLTFFASAGLLGTAVWMRTIGMQTNLIRYGARQGSGIVVGFGCAQLAIIFFHLMKWNAMTPVPMNQWLTGARFLLLMAGIAAAIILFLKHTAAGLNETQFRRLTTIILILFIVSELLGRYLFYAGYSRIGI